MENLLKKADAIMNSRAEEKDREYGPFVESIERAAIIADSICDVHISTKDFCKCLIALKIGRLKFNVKDDTIMDAMAYLDGLQKVEAEEQSEENLPIGIKQMVEALDNIDLKLSEEEIQELKKEIKTKYE